jgi:hypothetical protein
MEMKNFTDFTEKYSCQSCDIICSRKSEWSRHLLTRKHQGQSHGNDFQKNFTAAQIYNCHCGKKYRTHSGLWKHKKRCNFEIPIEKDILPPVPAPAPPPSDELHTLTNLVLELVKSNTNLQEQMLAVCKNSQPTNHIIHSNSHNKTFNLQFFLNETCKDAMNIMDFVDSFTLQLSDLEDVSKQGYVDGISNIIMKKLNELDVHKRPIHCSDAKREIMYVKDQNRWEKEDLGYAKLRKAIKYISKKNSDLLGQWSEAHPASKNITTQTNTEYMQMIVQAMGGRGEIGENESKIIKKIARTVLIEKD